MLARKVCLSFNVTLKQHSYAYSFSHSCIKFHMRIKAVTFDKKANETSVMLRLKLAVLITLIDER